MSVFLFTQHGPKIHSFFVTKFSKLPRSSPHSSTAFDTARKICIFVDIIKNKHLGFQSSNSVQLHSKKFQKIHRNKSIVYVCFMKRTLNGHLHVQYGVMTERKIMKDKPCFKVISSENISFWV